MDLNYTTTFFQMPTTQQAMVTCGSAISNGNQYSVLEELAEDEDFMTLSEEIYQENTWVRLKGA